MTTQAWLKIYGPFLFLILFTIGWVFLFRYISPEEIVERVGVKNTYVVAFVTALLCGFSSFTGSTFYLVIGTLAYGGANPLYIGAIRRGRAMHQRRIFTTLFRRGVLP